MGGGENGCGTGLLVVSHSPDGTAFALWTHAAAALSGVCSYYLQETTLFLEKVSYTGDFI